MLNRIMQKVRLLVGLAQASVYTLKNRKRIQKWFVEGELVLVGVVEFNKMDDPNNNVYQIKKIFYTSDPESYWVGLIVPARICNRQQELEA